MTGKLRDWKLFPSHDISMSIDDEGLITVEVDGKEYEVELKNVEKIEF